MERFLGFMGYGLLFLILISEFGWYKGVADAKVIRFPYEQLIYELEPGGKFHERLKYPSYRMCVKPNRAQRRKDSAGVKSGQTQEKKWRSFWSQSGWNAYYLDDEDATIAWESRREDPVPVDPFREHGLPIAFVMGWIIVITTCGLLLYPIFSMITIRVILQIWELISHRWIRLVIRKILVNHERFKRDHVLRVYEDAGRRPPFYRYSLPRFFRKNVREAVPKELDETDEEFWSSDEEDDEEKGAINEEQLKTLQATPEFTPEYPVDADEGLIVSDEMFSYLLRVSHHGMFAVWTNGLEDVNLADITAYSKRKAQPTTSK